MISFESFFAVGEVRISGLKFSHLLCKWLPEKGCKLLLLISPLFNSLSRAGDWSCGAKQKTDQGFPAHFQHNFQAGFQAGFQPVRKTDKPGTRRFRLEMSSNKIHWFFWTTLDSEVLTNRPCYRLLNCLHGCIHFLLCFKSRSKLNQSQFAQLTRVKPSWVQVLWGRMQGNVDVRVRNRNVKWE